MAATPFSRTQAPRVELTVRRLSRLTLLDKLSGDGIVIIDAPLLLPVTDAAIVAHSADGALITVSAGRTLDTELATAISHLTTVNARPLGVILNRVSKRTVGAGNYGTYYGYDDYNQEKGAPRRSGRPG